MSKAEQFGLVFHKWIDPTTNIMYNLCNKQAVDIYSHLQILDRFDAVDTLYIIKQINNASANMAFDSTPSSDSYEDLSIEITSQNAIINEVLTLPINDFEILLQEWLAFIS